MPIRSRSSHVFWSSTKNSLPGRIAIHPSIPKTSSKTMARIDVAAVLVFLTMSAPMSLAADFPAPKEGDIVLRDFRFRSGETLPEVRMHYRTLGAAQRDAQGQVNNAVLILHGTTGSSAPVPAARICRQAIRPGPAAGCVAILPSDSRQHRPRSVVQTERRIAGPLSQVRLSRHGRVATPLVD